MPPSDVSRAYKPSEFNPDPHADFRQSLDAPGGKDRAKVFLDTRLELMDKEKIAPDAQGRRFAEAALNTNDPDILNLTARYFSVPTKNKALGTPEQVRQDVEEIITNIQNGDLAKAKEHLKTIISLADPTFKDAPAERANTEGESLRTPVTQNADLAAPDANAHVADMQPAGPAALPPLEIAPDAAPGAADGAVNSSSDALTTTVRKYMGTDKPTSQATEVKHAASDEPTGSDLSQLGLGSTDVSGQKAETVDGIQQRMETKLRELASTNALVDEAHDPATLRRELGITEDQLKQMTPSDKARLGEELKGKLAAYGIAADLLPEIAQYVFGG
jgi:hypothetical protein